jgi:hypothetical protein
MLRAIERTINLSLNDVLGILRRHLDGFKRKPEMKPESGARSPERSSSLRDSPFEHLKREVNQLRQNAGRRPWAPKLPKARASGRPLKPDHKWRVSFDGLTWADSDGPGDPAVFPFRRQVRASRWCHCGDGGCVCCGGKGACLGSLPPERLLPEKP